MHHDVLHEWLELQGVQDKDCCKDYVAENEKKPKLLKRNIQMGKRCDSVNYRDISKHKILFVNGQNKKILWFHFVEGRQ